MNYETLTFYPLLIIVVMAALVPFTVRKIKVISMPIVVGEIIIGIIIGKSGLNLVPGSDWLDYFYKLGFAFLMFMSGLEINLKLIGPINSIRKGQLFKQSYFIAGALFLCTFLLSIGSVVILKYLNVISNVVIFVIVISSTSVGVVVPILKERGLLITKYGQTILIASLLADFSTMVLLSVYVTMNNSNSIGSNLMILLFIPIFILVLKIGKKILNQLIVEELAHENAQIKVRGTIAVLIAFMTLAQVFKTEMILGAFLAGLVVSLINDRETSQIYRKLDAIGYGFFIPLFFIMVGMNFEVKDIINSPESLILLPILIAAIIIVNLVSAVFLKSSFSSRQSIAAVSLLSSRLSLIIAAGTVGLKLGLISASENSVIILVAIVSCICFPLVFNHLFNAQDLS